MSTDLRPPGLGAPGPAAREGRTTSLTRSARTILATLRRLRPPVGDRRFWVVQAGVLFVAVTDMIVLDVVGLQLPFGIPRSTITALLLVPVIYAALNFGVRGAVATALWATAIMIPDWFFIEGVTSASAWGEIGNLAILNGVAVVVGQRVEREGQARLRAEESLRASQVAQARYRAEAEHRAREQGAYASHLIVVQEDERRRLAQDLHDDPLQTLTYLVRMLEQLTEDPRLPPDLAPVVLRDGELATVVVDSLRAVIHGLRPPVLDDFGVVAALRQLVAEVHSRHGILVGLQVSGEQVRLSPQCELTLYRVAQEALSNVVRHAQATSARVDLRFGEQVVLTVTDDGCGMGQGASESRSTPAPPAGSASGAGPVSSGGGLGLIGMRERVNQLGGTLEVRDSTPHGTMVRATLANDFVPGGLP
jgi:two-component system sensor histidine kinase DegS